MALSGATGSPAAPVERRSLQFRVRKRALAMMIVRAPRTPVEKQQLLEMTPAAV